MSLSTVSKFAKFDPAHLLDGLFTPTAKKGEALFDVKGTFKNKKAGESIEISFEGVQMSAKHQSLLLAIAARTAQQPSGEALLVRGTADDIRSKQIKMLEMSGLAEDMDISIVKCSAYKLLIDAGMSTGKSDYKAMICILRQMATITMYRGVGLNGGTSHLLSFQHKSDQFVVSLNWRLAGAILGGQNIQISLHERRALSESPVAKIVHAWLSGHIRLGGQFMAGRGVEVNTLIRHVWGKRQCSEAVTKQRRSRIKVALNEIGKLNGWVVRLERAHAFISRPKALAELMSPGDVAEFEQEILDEIYESRG